MMPKGLPVSPNAFGRVLPPPSSSPTKGVGNNISSADGLHVPANTLSKASRDTSSLFVLLDSFLLCGTPFPNGFLHSFVNFPSW